MNKETDQFKEFLAIYQIYRDHVKHEDTLLNQRLSFLIASQSFLFVPYFMVLRDCISNEHNNGYDSFLLLLICFLGVLINLLTESSIQAFIDASSAIGQQWKTKYLKSPYCIIKPKGYNPDPDIKDHEIEIGKNDLDKSTNLAFLTFGSNDDQTTIPNIRYENNSEFLKRRVNCLTNKMPYWFILIWLILFFLPFFRLCS